MLPDHKTHMPALPCGVVLRGGGDVLKKHGDQALSAHCPVCIADVLVNRHEFIDQSGGLGRQLNVQIDRCRLRFGLDRKNVGHSVDLTGF